MIQTDFVPPSSMIRTAKKDDAKGLIPFVQRLAEEPGRNIPLAPGEFNLSIEEEQKILGEYERSDNSVFLVALSGEEPIGLLTCSGGKRRATRHAVTLGISVSREWRNRKIGRRLMQEAIEWARGTGIVHRIELFVYARNALAIHLYEEFGFQLEGRRRHAVCEDGEYLDDLMMSLLI